MAIRLFIIVFVMASAVVVGLAQNADNRTSIIPRPGADDDRDKPRSLRETMDKLRIEKEKKEFQQMIERGQEAVKISEQLEKAYAQNGRLTERELDQVEEIEKLAKKIRSELGGDDDSEKNEEKASAPMPPANEAVKSFREKTLGLLDELKKTTRFTISASAIQASNAVIKLAKFLRLKN